jgi:hypothetical protein
MDEKYSDEKINSLCRIHRVDWFYIRKFYKIILMRDGSAGRQREAIWN